MVAILVAFTVIGCGGPTPSPATPFSVATNSPSVAAASSGPPLTSPTTTGTPAAGGPPAIAIEQVLEGLDSPLDIAFRPSQPTSLFIVEQTGRIRIVRDGKLVDRPFLDIRSLVLSGGEQGLLGLAFLPSAKTGRFFVYYTDRDGKENVASYDTSSIDVGKDLGQGASPRYRVPPDNPFLSTKGARPEIYLTGLRNPWRLRFDRATGDLWIGDVGQNSWEEIDVVRSGTPGGLDFGWNVLEGTHCFRGQAVTCDEQGLTLPVAEYGHDQGCSVTGGTVYRGARAPALQGWYVFSDYCSGSFWAIDAANASPEHTAEPAPAATSHHSISAIAEDAAGDLYATDLSTGALLRIGVAGG
jgi:glucose/arabinose dehydrogenase